MLETLWERHRIGIDCSVEGRIAAAPLALPVQWVSASPGGRSLD
jgi:hypothetical protein